MAHLPEAKLSAREKRAHQYMVQLPDQALASASAGRQTITRVATVPEPWHGAVNSLRRARHRPFIPDQHPRRGAKLLDELP